MSQKPVGVILAGGQARRMGRSKNGLDKGLFDLGGQTMLLRVVRRLQPQVQSLVISANGDPARFNDFGLEVTEDSIQGYLGPLAGILAGLDWAVNKGATHVVSVAVDTPFFPCDLVVELQKSARLQKQPIVLAASHDPQKG
ncbi:MAG: molybdenum cofactor guanylyltransferase, partial [Devosiaceae bacterium]|nr:molybdenum cofactor guanylyltransferase [Devosiaceae bacterium]